MGLLDAIFRKKPPVSKADNLFKLPVVTIDLEQAGFSFAGKAGVCFRPFDTTDFEQTKSDILKILKSADPVTNYVTIPDSFGYLWIIIQGSIDTAVASINMIYTMLEDAGYDQYILCSVFEYVKGARKIYWIYNKKGKFYPFAPVDKERDVALELRLKALTAESLPVEGSVTLWFPLWDMPF